VTRGGLARSALATLVVLTACGGAPAPAASRPTPPPVVPADLVRGLASDATVLDPEGVAADATDPGALAELLRRSGFVVASQREFHGMTPSFNRVVARTAVFRDERGADAYLSWIEAHPDALLGPSERLRPLPFGETSVLFALEPCGTCHAELPTYLAAWRREATVRLLLASGRQASRRTLMPIASALDRL
jgi:hypothetical protein